MARLDDSNERVYYIPVNTTLKVLFNERSDSFLQQTPPEQLKFF